MKLTHLDNNQDVNERKNPFPGLPVCKRRRTKRSRPFVSCKGIWLLNDDMMIEILSQLPIESVPQMKHVCKRWYDLAKSHSFRNRHFHKGQTAEFGIFIQGSPYTADDKDRKDLACIDYIAIGKEGEYKLNKNRLDFLPEKVVITASLNGLVVCRSLFKKMVDLIQLTIPPEEELVIYVCNPLTKDFITVKPCISRRDRCWVGLSFISSDSFSTSFELLVVHYVETEQSENCYLFMIFSSQTKTWKISTDLFCYSHAVNFDRNVLLDGIFYWLTEGGTILAFDLKTEKTCIIELPLPELLTYTTSAMCLGESDGYVHYVCVSYEAFGVWILNTDTDSKPEWKMKYYGLLSNGSDPVLVDPGSWDGTPLSDGTHLCHGRLPRTDIIVPISFKDDVVFLRFHYCFSSYDLKTDHLKEICSFGALYCAAVHKPIALPYCMSLLPVCSS